MDACPSYSISERGTVLIRIDLLGGRCWWGGVSYNCVGRKLVTWLLAAGEGRRGRRQFGTLVSLFVLCERLVLCGACREYRGSFQIVLLMSNVINFHAATASTLASAVSMVLKSKWGGTSMTR